MRQYFASFKVLSGGQLLGLAAVGVLFVVCVVLLREWGDAGWGWAMADRLAEGKEPTLKHITRTMLFWAVLADAVVLGLLLLTGPLWLADLRWDGGAQRSSGSTGSTGSTGSSRDGAGVGWSGLMDGVRLGSRWFWVLILGALLVGGVLRGVRLPLSVYNDEEYTLRTYVRGTFEMAERDLESVPVWEPVSWGETVWLSKMGPNMVVFSVLSRASLSGWQVLRGGDERDFAEWVFRLPSFLAGLGLVVLLGVLGRQYGGDVAGVSAAWLAALHPWLVRYSSEGRGYMLGLMFLVLCWVVLRGALERGRGEWRWWLIYAVAQVGVLGSYQGHVYVLVVQNLVVLGVIWWQWGSDRVRAYPAWGLSLRWVVANTLSVAALVTLLGPLVPQVLEFMRHDIARQVTPAGYLVDYWSYLSAGMPWDRAGVLSVLEQGWWPGGLWAVAVVPLLALLGVWMLVRDRREGADLRSRLGLGLLVVAVLSPLFGYFENVAQGRYLHIWYLIYGLPGLVWLLGLGAAMAGLLWRGGSSRGRVAVTAGVLVALTGAAWSLPLGVYLGRSKQQMKDAVVLMDRPVDASAEAGSEAGLEKPLSMACWVATPFYDPYCHVIYDREVLEAGIEKARREGRGLMVAYGMRGSIEKLQPEILELLEDERVFEPVGMLPGLETLDYDTYVVRLREQE